MKKLYLLLFLFTFNLARAAEGGSTRGNGGGQRHLEQFLLPLRSSYGELSSINLNDRVNQFFENSKNLDCDILQNYFSLAIGLLEFFRDTGFEFKDSNNNIIDLSSLNIKDLRSKYSEPGACVDKSMFPKGTALLEITDELPPEEYEQDLMALNFENSGKLTVFRQNWKASEVLKRESCRKLGESLNESLALQRSCLYATQLSISMHEILSLAGIKQERTKRYDVSSYFALLPTLNRKNPDPKAIQIIEHIIQHYLDSFKKLEHFDFITYKAAEKLLNLPPLSGKELDKAYGEWKEVFFDLNLIAKRFKVAYFNINIFLEFLIPNSFVPYSRHFTEYKDKHLSLATPRLGFLSLTKDSYVKQLLAKKFSYSESKELQKILFEMSFFSDLLLGEHYELSADIYEFNKTLPHEILRTKKTADEILDWGCKQFPGLNGKRNFQDGR